MKKLLITALLASLSLPAAAYDWTQLLQIKDALSKSSKSSSGQSALDALTPTEMSGALKEALTKGAEAAVSQLGKQDGFYGDKLLRIPLPDNLKKADSLMRTFGMGKQADDLILSMNRAAEAAVPEAQALLVTTVKNMTLDDAKGILTGGNEAATKYFREKTETQLDERFLPIVKNATDKVGLAKTYNKYAGLAARFGLLKADQATIEAYVSQQALDRLYRVIGQQEQAIRANPVGYGSDLIKKVFEAASGQK